MQISTRWLALLLALLAATACGTSKEEAPRPPDGIHWDAIGGVLTLRHDRRVSTVEFVRVEAGRFRMGGTDLPRTILSEGPVRYVHLGADFWLAATELTREQWHAFSDQPPPENPLEPMTRVSWTEVHTFIQRLNQHSTGRFRLPSEKEWEFACRAGSATEWPWEGDKRHLAQYGWYQGNAGSHLQPVAGKQPNALGFFDMHGNAVEWTAAAAGVTNRVLRGGFVGSTAAEASCVCRYQYPAEYGYQFAGFRLAAD
jgi:formylglycine-generating enzyme required for sulfatase activity